MQSNSASVALLSTHDRTAAQALAAALVKKPSTVLASFTPVHGPATVADVRQVLDLS